MLQSDLLYSVAKPPQEPKEQRIKIIYWEVPVPYVEVQVGNLSIKLSLLQCRDFAGDLLAAADKAEANTEVAVIDAAYRKAAKAQYEEEGEIEVDDNAIVSKGDDDGAYVASWLWVSKQEAGICTRCDHVNVNGEGSDELCGNCADKAEPEV